MSEHLSPLQWQRVSALFDAAVELPEAERAAFLARACGDDVALRLQLERMLQADARDAALDSGAAAWLDLDALEAQDPAQPDPALGQTRGVWRLQSVLGRGGMGTVYAAQRSDGSGQRAAVKCLHARWDGGAQAQRFEQERRILAALSHPHIPHLIDHGVDDQGRPWLALEHVDGQPITHWADAQRLTLAQRVTLFLQVCGAVQYAHAHFVVHRDLKPANLLVDTDGRAQVLDFGVAKRTDAIAGTTRTGLMAGFTPEYAAPEQISNGPVSAATDVYALGVVLYQLLTGRLPYAFEQDNLRQVAEAISLHAPMRLEQALVSGQAADIAARIASRRTDAQAFRRFVRGDLSRILETALAKEPQRRYPSVQAFADDLQRLLDGRPVSVTGDTPAYRARKFIGRNRWGSALAALLVLALAGGVTGIVSKSRQAQQQAQRANVQAQRATREAARAATESARAKLETERMAASNEFLRSVFSMATASNNHSPNLSLRDALDLAVKQISKERSDPQLRVRFLLAASSSYEALGDNDTALAVARQAMAVQEASLRDSREDRARVLSAMAWLRVNYEPKQSLAWARESVQLALASTPRSITAISEAYSVLSTAQYFNDDVPGAIGTTRAARKLILDNGAGEDSIDVITSYSNEALMLASLSRFDEALALHQRAVDLRAKALGADAVATMQERVFYGYTLNRAQHFDAALAQFSAALPVLRKELGDTHDSTQQTNLGLGRALVGLGRDREALAPLSAAYRYGQTHPFEDRQGSVAYYLAQAHARLGACDDVRRVLAALHAHGQALPRELPDPRKGTRCQTPG